MGDKMNNFRKPKVIRDEAYYIYKGKQLDAAKKLNVAVKSGRIKKPDTCSICGGNGKIIGHHYRGYDYPYSIWWLCQRCNVILQIHDNSISRSQAQIYVINKRRYNDYYQMRGSMYERGSDVYEGAKLAASKYIDFELARIDLKSPDLGKMIDSYHTKKSAIATIIVFGHQLSSKRQWYDTVNVYQNPIGDVLGFRDWIWSESVKEVYVTIWADNKVMVAKEFENRKPLDHWTDFIPVAFEQNGKVPEFNRL